MIPFLKVIPPSAVATNGNIKQVGQLEPLLPPRHNDDR